jgi:hypothetical protein
MSTNAVIGLFLVGCVAIVGATVYAAMNVPEFLGRHVSGCRIEETGGAALVAGSARMEARHEGSKWHATRTLTFAHDALPRGATLMGCVDTGHVEVLQGEGPRSVVEVFVHGYATSEQAARDAAQRLTPEVRGGPEGLWAWHPRGETTHARGIGATMTIRFLLPAGSAVAGHLTTDTGNVAVERVGLTQLYAATDTGRIRLEPGAAEGALVAHTDTGGIVARLPSLGEGHLRFHTDTGSIQVQVPGSARHGYDIRAGTDTGAIRLDLPDLRDVAADRDHRHARTSGFADKAVQVAMDLRTDTGGITVQEVA